MLLGGGKSEARNPKHETNSNGQNSNRGKTIMPEVSVIEAF
jgi:hypothetical protein